jgi:hypothetical protein
MRIQFSWDFLKHWGGEFVVDLPFFPSVGEKFTIVGEDRAPDGPDMLGLLVTSRHWCANADGSPGEGDLHCEAYGLRFSKGGWQYIETFLRDEIGAINIWQPPMELLEDDLPQPKGTR